MAEERYLLIQLRQLGDILLTTPCVAALRRARPKAKIAFLSHDMGRLVLDGNPHIDEHFVYQQGWSLPQRLRFLATLRERRFNRVIDFMNNPRSALFAFATGAPERVAFRSARRLAYTKTVDKPAEPRYIVERKMLLLQALGLSTPDLGELGKAQLDQRAVNLILPWGEHHTRPLMQLVGSEPGFKQAALRVILSPTHRRAARRWPLSSYAALADFLVREWGAAVVWLWGPGGEEAEVDAARALCHVPTIKAPATGYREMAALIANSDLFVGNSNGPSHVAVAVGTPSLQLHGPTEGAAWCPPRLDHHRYLQAPLVDAEGRGRLDALSVEAAIAVLAQMRPAIAEHQERLKQQGPRFQWRRP